MSQPPSSESTWLALPQSGSIFIDYASELFTVMLSNIVILSGLFPYSDLCCSERSCISPKFVMIGSKLKCLMSSWMTCTICHITQWPQSLSSAECVVSCMLFSLLYNDMCACIYVFYMCAHILIYCMFMYLEANLLLMEYATKGCFCDRGENWMEKKS